MIAASDESRVAATADPAVVKPGSVEAVRAWLIGPCDRLSRTGEFRPQATDQLRSLANAVSDAP